MRLSFCSWEFVSNICRLEDHRIIIQTIKFILKWKKAPVEQEMAFVSIFPYFEYFNAAAKSTRSETLL